MQTHIAYPTSATITYTTYTTITTSAPAAAEPLARWVPNGEDPALQGRGVP